MEPGNVVFESLIEADKKDIEHMTEEYKKICTPEHLADRVLGILESQKGNMVEPRLISLSMVYRQQQGLSVVFMSLSTTGSS